MRNEHLVYYSIGLQILIFHNSWIANPAEQVLKEIQKIPQPKPSPELRIANSNLTLGI
jgi:hypothetical protein